MIRDQALAVSGLLTSPSVVQRFPLSAGKLYDGVVVGADYPGTAGAKLGPDLYRAVSTLFGSAPSPTPMVTFDAPDPSPAKRCDFRRTRRFGALLLMSVAISKPRIGLGARMLREGGTDDSSACLVSDSPQAETSREETPCSRTHCKHCAGLRSAWRDATRLLKTGASAK